MTNRNNIVAVRLLLYFTFRLPIIISLENGKKKNSLNFTILTLLYMYMQVQFEWKVLKRKSVDRLEKDVIPLKVKTVPKMILKIQSKVKLQKSSQNFNRNYAHVKDCSKSLYLTIIVCDEESQSGGYSGLYLDEIQDPRSTHRRQIYWLYYIYYKKKKDFGQIKNQHASYQHQDNLNALYGILVSFKSTSLIMPEIKKILEPVPSYRVTELIE